ncbi:MAG: Lipoprotein signal peptidase [candidate division WS2 bacterium ADurb.Bin280]|uniref:Lipoprotein signal peptidase n=1 Tax=candidate division WS2 bacterium ADurb.Bin280 TaxID=1852829 RepID=A0A1V5SGD1_9BACT|nr:MAG: Lipoprotein signal peptidase [candidate division WS2 bacterium ADurb.Bin280]
MPPTQNKRLSFALFLVLLLVVIDQLGKDLAIRHFGPIISGNTGGSFGVLSGFEFYKYASLILTIVIFVYFLKCKTTDKVLVAIMLGGALSNTIDRFARGFVVDYISLPYWPSFNLADTLIFVSALTLAYKTIRRSSGGPKLN